MLPMQKGSLLQALDGCLSVVLFLLAAALIVALIVATR